MIICFSAGVCVIKVGRIMRITFNGRKRPLCDKWINMFMSACAMWTCVNVHICILACIMAAFLISGMKKQWKCNARHQFLSNKMKYRTKVMILTGARTMSYTG